MAQMKLLSAAAIRRCLVADEGKAIITADFDQIELRVAAALAGETSLIEAAKRNESLHKVVALKVFSENYTPDEYRYAKNLDFGWLFGGGADTLSKQTGITFSKAAGLIHDFEEMFPALKMYKRRKTENVLRSALSSSEYKAYRALKSRMYMYRTDTSEGKAARKMIQLEIKRLCYRKIGYVTTPFGRRLIVDAEKAYNVVNYEVQSSAADLMKDALLDVMGDPELEPTVLLPIHDEILGQENIDKAEYTAQRYAEVMTRTFMGVPISASGKVYGKSWGHGYHNNKE